MIKILEKYMWKSLFQVRTFKNIFQAFWSYVKNSENAEPLFKEHLFSEDYFWFLSGGLLWQINF